MHKELQTIHPSIHPCFTSCRFYYLIFLLTHKQTDTDVWTPLVSLSSSHTPIYGFAHALTLWILGYLSAWPSTQPEGQRDIHFVTCTRLPEYAGSFCGRGHAAQSFGSVHTDSDCEKMSHPKGGVKPREDCKESHKQRRKTTRKMLILKNCYVRGFMQLSTKSQKCTEFLFGNATIPTWTEVSKIKLSYQGLNKKTSWCRIIHYAIMHLRRINVLCLLAVQQDIAVKCSVCRILHRAKLFVQSMQYTWLGFRERHKLGSFQSPFDSCVN